MAVKGKTIIKIIGKDWRIEEASRSQTKFSFLEKPGRTVTYDSLVLKNTTRKIRILGVIQWRKMIYNKNKREGKGRKTK